MNLTGMAGPLCRACFHPRLMKIPGPTCEPDFRRKQQNGSYCARRRRTHTNRVFVGGFDAMRI